MGKDSFLDDDFLDDDFLDDDFLDDEGSLNIQKANFKLTHMMIYIKTVANFWWNI